jgi:hypothetical protein
MAEPESAPPVDALTECLARVLSELPPEDAEGEVPVEFRLPRGRTYAAMDS